MFLQSNATGSGGALADTGSDALANIIGGRLVGIGGMSSIFPVTDPDALCLAISENQQIAIDN